jgi:hypothetical protein
MVGAKQLRTLCLSWFRPGPYVQQGCARGTILLRTRVPVVGRLQAKWERRRGPQVPRGVIEASANIGGGRRRACERSLSVVPCLMFRVLPPRRGESPPFYRPRRGRFTGMSHYLATCGGMVYSAAELTAVLAKLAPITVSRRVLCLNRGDFEGGGVVVDRGVSRRARGSR